MQISVERYIHTYLYIYYSNILLRFYSKYAIASLNSKYPSLLNLASKYRYKSIKRYK